MERLQKRIAASGLCSRRKAEELIAAGKVKVNGKIVKELGSKVSKTDLIEVNGKKPPQSKNTTIAFYKPRGVLTSKSDPFHEETVMNLLPEKFRHLNPVGRLDKDSEGLLIFTSDGALLNRLTHARYGHKKVYRVLVRGTVKPESIKQIKRGGQILDGYKLQPMNAKILETEPNATWLEITLSEGRKRQIRRVMEGLGHPVLKLIRVKIGNFTLEPLQEKEWHVLSAEELKKL